MIERPTRTVYDWHGPLKEAPGVGTFLCSDAGSVWRIMSARRIKVRVSHGETARFAFQLVRWPREELPEGARMCRIEWVRRGRR